MYMMFQSCLAPFACNYVGSHQVVVVVVVIYLFIYLFILQPGDGKEPTTFISSMCKLEVIK